MYNRTDKEVHAVRPMARAGAQASCDIRLRLNARHRLRIARLSGTYSHDLTGEEYDAVSASRSFIRSSRGDGWLPLATVVLRFGAEAESNLLGEHVGRYHQLPIEVFREHGSGCYVTASCWSGYLGQARRG